MLGYLIKFKVQTVLILEYKKSDYRKSIRKIYHSCDRLIASDSDVDKVFESMHQSIMTKLKNYISKDWIVETNAKHGVKVFKCYYRRF